MPEERPPDSRELGISFTLAQVGLEMVAPLVAGVFIDYYADTGPWVTIAGAILGFVGGMAHIVALANQQEKARRTEDKKKGDKPP